MTVQCKDKRAHHKRKGEPPRLTCQHCGDGYQPRQSQDKSMFCGSRCKQLAFTRRRDPLVGKRNEMRRISREQRDRAVAEAREQKRLDRIAKMYAEKQRECRACGIGYSSLHRDTAIFCTKACAVFSRRSSKAASRVARKLLERAASVESVNPLRVFQRDRWKCYLCGISTPAELRGSYEPNAPELEHMHPISKGGEHSYENSRCACRSCNSKKADMTLPEYIAHLSRLAGGVVTLGGITT